MCHGAWSPVPRFVPGEEEEGAAAAHSPTVHNKHTQKLNKHVAVNKQTNKHVAVA